VWSQSHIYGWSGTTKDTFFVTQKRPG
jgi:hypothetical protein